ncbi:hypothetical protein AB1L88_16755 [Tautonia sp. JC769]
MHHRLLITLDAEPDATSEEIRRDLFERLTEDAIGRKWLVVVDYHD